MALKRQQPSILFLLLALVTIMISSIANATDCVGNGSISVYWGQGADSAVEGTLKETCDSELYNIVIIEGLIVHDDGSNPVLNLANHCGSVEHPCTELQSQIEYCQKEKNVKIFLSINSDVPAAARISNTQDNEEEDEAKKLAEYLLKNYLSGQPGPLGSVSLDGIDLEDVSGSSHLKWDDLVKAITASTTERKIYLSASPQCVYPDVFLGDAIKTGLFDYIWVEFYDPNPCIYSKGDATNLLNAWKTWTSNVPNSLIFLGLAASEEAATEGYIPPEDLKSTVLPTAKEASNYGGVMIWNRYYDVKNNYTDQIKDSVLPKVCRCVCDTEPVASASVYGRVESI